MYYLLDNFTCTIFLGGQRLIQKTYKGIVMDANVRASDYRSTIISFRSSSFTFTVGNIASLVIIVFGDLTSQAQLALAAFVVILNLASVLSFENAIGGFSVLAKDQQNENSNMGKEAGKAPFGFFRIFCLVICIVAAVTQLLAIYA